MAPVWSGFLNTERQLFILMIFFWGGGAGPDPGQFVQSPPIWRVDERLVDNGWRRTEMGGWFILSFNRFLIQIIFRILKQTYSQYGNTGLFN